MKTILVTGSNGFLGMKLTAALAGRRDVELIATGKGPNRYPDQVGYRYAEMDITDKASIRTVFEKFRPDALIHTAAISHVDVCENDPELAQTINAEATRNLAKMSDEMSTHFVFVSTDFVFDGRNGPYDESAETNPVNVYGRTKREAEKIVARLSTYAIVRTILVYGQPVDRARSNIIVWALKELAAGRKIRVASDHWRMPTLVEDLARACIFTAQNRHHGVYHISGREGLSMVELVRKAADFWQLDPSLIEPVLSSVFPQSAERPMRTGFILDKAKKELAFHPHSLEEGFALMAEQQKKQG